MDEEHVRKFEKYEKHVKPFSATIKMEAKDTQSMYIKTIITTYNNDLK